CAASHAQYDFSDGLLERNSARAEALAHEHARFSQRFFAFWEEGMRTVVWPYTSIRKQAEPVSAE
ncbi:MAG TPA: hypothetical protein VM715_09215, partial [Candidatus Acidoferrum sp.]|nr:hypothetical protein [Candidatus Acidoferrum sp.]